MAAPTCGVQAADGRHSYTSEILYDINSGAPFPPLGSGDPNLAGYTWLIEYSNVGPVGPWIAAPLQTSQVNVCSGLQPDNIIPIDVGSSKVLIGDQVPSLFVNSQHWTQWTLRDETATPVPGGQLVCGPVTTNDFAQFICTGVIPLSTSANAQYGSIADPADITSPCDIDGIQWQISNGGPFINDGPQQPINSLSPSHTFNGLTPATNYQVRATLFESAALGGAPYTTGPVCAFQTAAAAQETGEICCGLAVHEDWDNSVYGYRDAGVGHRFHQCYPPGTGSTVS